MDKVVPIIQRIDTEDGWITTADYGKGGISRSQVHVAQGTPEDAAKNRREMNRVLARYGYKIAGT